MGLQQHELGAAVALRAAAGLCRFLLVSGAAWCLCGLLRRLATTARVRFWVCLAFLLGCAGAWLQALLEVLGPSLAGSSLAGSSLAGMALGGPGAAAAGGGVLLRFALPGEWAPGLAPVLSMLLAAYLLVVAGLLLRAAARRLRLARVLRFRMEPPAALRMSFDGLAREHGMAGCRLWLLPGLPSPGALGMLSPAVYLPLEMLSGPARLEKVAPEESGLGGVGLGPSLEAVLRHELAHLRRRDPVVEWLARVCWGLLFFHPLAYRALVGLRLERELACDAAVLRGWPERRAGYAETLLRFGRRAGGGWPTVRFAARPSTLQIRVRAVLAGERTYCGRAKRRRAVGAAVGVWAFAALAPALTVALELVGPALVRPASARPTLVAEPRLAVERSGAPAGLGRRHVAAARAERLAGQGRLEDGAQLAGRGLELPALSPVAPPLVRYESTHTAGERLVAERRPVAPEGAEQLPGDLGGGSGPSKRQPRTGLGAPTVSVLVGAAVALGRLGADHDRDRK